MLTLKRKTTSDENAESDERKIPIKKLKWMVENMQETIEDIKENQESILEKLEQLDKTELEEESEEKPSFHSVFSPGSLMKNAPSTPPIGRSFVLKHTFENVSKCDKYKRYSSKAEDHFGVSWSFEFYKVEQRLRVYLQCHEPLKSGNWAINTKCTLRLLDAERKVANKKNGCHSGLYNENTMLNASGITKCIAWEELKDNYLIEDKLVVEVHVEILEMSGVYKENLRCFDESIKDVSDVVLVVGNKKFYISKLFLATHSSYFKTLFLGNFQESNQSEIELSGISPEDFQNYLEVLYGDPAIDDTTVEGILLVADMYDTSMVIRKCIDFLVEKSQKSMKKKLQMAIRYNLDQLKKKLIADMKTLADIESVMPENPEDLGLSVSVELLNKSLSLR